MSLKNYFIEQQIQDPLVTLKNVPSFCLKDQKECFKKGVEYGLNIQKKEYCKPTISKKEYILKHTVFNIFFAFLMSLSVIYTIYLILKNVKLPHSFVVVFIIVMEIIFIALFVYLNV